MRVLATHSIRQSPLHLPSRGSPCAIRFRTSSTTFVLRSLTSQSELFGVFKDFSFVDWPQFLIFESYI